MTRWSLVLVLAFVVGSLIGHWDVDNALPGQTAPISAQPVPQEDSPVAPGLAQAHQTAQVAAQAGPKELQSYRNIVEQVLPAVVSIETRARPAVEEYQQSLSDMPAPFVRRGFGSGFIVDPKGVVLTNYHVVAGPQRRRIEMQDGRIRFQGDQGRSQDDLAIVRIESKKPLPYLELGDDEAMEIGDRVLAVGLPLGCGARLHPHHQCQGT